MPYGWECVVENGIASFREKKGHNSNPPRSWGEFCEKFLIKP